MVTGFLILYLIPRKSHVNTVSTIPWREMAGCVNGKQKDGQHTLIVIIWDRFHFNHKICDYLWPFQIIKR